MDARLLLLRDDSIAALRTWRALESHGYSVTLASSLDEARELHVGRDLAAVIVFGDRDTRNAALLGRLRALGMADVLIVVTGRDDEAFDRAMRAQGADECLSHAVLREDQLVRWVEALVRASRARACLAALKHCVGERSRMLARLRAERRRAASHLLGSIRGPVHEVLVHSEVLLRQLRGPIDARQRDSLLALREASSRLGALVRTAPAPGCRAEAEALDGPGPR